MAKKSESKSKPAVPAKRAAKPTTQAKAKLAPPTMPVTVTEPGAAVAPAKPAKSVKSATKKTKPAAKAVKPKAPSYSRDDVALRAYFISEKRQAQGLPGDEHRDWIEAERQLAEESKSSKKAVKA